MSASITDEATSADTGGRTLSELSGSIKRAQGLLDAFGQDLIPRLEREADHLGDDLEVLEDWTGDAEEEGAFALAEADVVVRTSRKRVDYLEEQIGEADAGLRERLERLDGALEDIQDRVDSLEVSRVAYATYVNRGFAARYDESTVQVSTILQDTGRKDVEELGLYPLDDLFGNAIPELAFPANREVDLRDDNRTYWESESDGGLVA